MNFRCSIQSLSPALVVHVVIRARVNKFSLEEFCLNSQRGGGHTSLNGADGPFDRLCVVTPHRRRVRGKDSQGAKSCQGICDSAQICVSAIIQRFWHQNTTFLVMKYLVESVLAVSDSLVTLVRTSMYVAMKEIDKGPQIVQFVFGRH